MEIYLRTFCDRHLPLFVRWAGKEHIKKWYEPVNEWIKEIKGRENGYSWIKHFIIYAEEIPVGFCQYYPYWKSGEDWQGNIPLNGTYSIDYFIGEENYLGKGYAKKALGLLISKVFSLPDAKRIIAQPERDNAASRNTLLAAGFEYDCKNNIFYHRKGGRMNKIITKEAKETLANADAKLAKLIEICGNIDEPPLEEDYLQSLLSSVIGQQLSGKVADVIWKRFKSYLKNEITAERVLSADNEALRALGISYSKISYLKSIASAVINKTLDLENINNYCDEEIITQLVKIKGVGRWTAEMFLIFSLGRRDVYSLGDGGLTRAVKNLYNFEKEPTKAQLIEISSKWTPYKTAASLYLWRSLEKEIAALMKYNLF